MKKMKSFSIYYLLALFCTMSFVSCDKEIPEVAQQGPKLNFLNQQHFNGEKNVTLTVEFPGDEGAEWVDNEVVKTFKDAKTYSYTGKTTIVFDEKKSSDDKKVFSMTANAMGLKEFMYEVFKNKTFRSDSYGNDEATPPSGLLMKKAGLKLEDVLAGKDKETFDVSLADIIFEGDKAPEFVFDAKGAYDAEIKAVPLVCSYSAWERILKLKKAGDKEIDQFENPTEEGEFPQSIEAVGFTLNPNYYFNVTTIEKDEHEDKAEYYTPAKASYNKEKKELTFEFSMDYADLGNYIKIKAVYSL